jgi:hypothetical protein
MRHHENNRNQTSHTQLTGRRSFEPMDHWIPVAVDFDAFQQELLHEDIVSRDFLHDDESRFCRATSRHESRIKAYDVELKRTSSQRRSDRLRVVKGDTMTHPRLSKERKMTTIIDVVMSCQRLRDSEGMKGDCQRLEKQKGDYESSHVLSVNRSEAQPHEQRNDVLRTT